MIPIVNFCRIYSHLLVFMLFLFFVSHPSIVQSGDATRYKAEVLVLDQSSEEFDRGLKAGMTDVLETLRVNGLMTKNPQGLIERAEDFLLQFGYNATINGQGLLLKIRFDQEALESELKTTRRTSAKPATVSKPKKAARINTRETKPKVATKRPDLLMWLAVLDPNNPYLLGEDDRPKAVAAMKEEAKQQGLNLKIPLLDTKDQRAVDVDDVRAGLNLTLWDASRRYQIRHVIYGTLQKRGGRWAANWTRLFDGKAVNSWENEGNTASLVLSSSFKTLSSELVKKPVVETRSAGLSKSSKRSGYILTVRNVRNYVAYKRVENKLQSMSRGVRLLSMAGDEVKFDIGVNGLNQLKSDIQNNPSFTLLPNAGQDNELIVDFLY